MGIGTWTWTWKLFIWQKKYKHDTMLEFPQTSFDMAAAHTKNYAYIFSFDTDRFIHILQSWLIKISIYPHFMNPVVIEQL